VLALLRELPLICRDRLQFTENLHRGYGEIVALPLLPQTRFIIYHPAMIKQVLVTNAANYTKGRSFIATGDFLEDSVSTSEGAMWKEQRKALNPFFHKDAVLAAAPDMQATIAGRMARLHELPDETINLSREFRLIALALTLKVIFACELSEGQMQQIVEDMHVVLDASTDLSMLPLPLAMAAGFKGRRYRQALARLQAVAQSLLAQCGGALVPSKCPVSRIIAAMPGRQRLNNTLNMILGGTDTVANTLMWTVHNLQLHPAVLAQVMAEIRADQVSSERQSTNSEKETKWPYISRVIAETLRLYPQNWMMSRDALGPDVLGGVDIPPGSTVYMAVYWAHRRADFWSNPLEFDPLRFDGDNLFNHQSYLPFGLGQRKCLGSLMAVKEMPEVLAQLLRRFEITGISSQFCQDSVASFTLRPKQDIYVRLKKRSLSCGGCSG
jgi:cytochrome P450